jgi:anti-sigma B factor antagonist
MGIQEALGNYNTKHSQDKAELTTGPGLMVLKLFGPLDQDNATDFMVVLGSAVDSLSTGERLVMDMSSINYISSTGVGALSQTLVHAEKRGVSFVLRAIQPKIRGVIQLLGLLSYFTEEKSLG